MSAEAGPRAAFWPSKMLGALRVKPENGQVEGPYKIMYSLYRLLPITLKLALRKGDTEQTVQPVQIRSRFDNPALGGG